MASLEEQPLVNSFNKVFLGAAGTDTDTGPSDDAFNRVSFLSHFEGSNNGVNNAFDDGSTNNYTVIVAGDVTQGSFNPYGTNWGVDFPDSDPDDADTQPFVTVTSHADLAIGANDDYTFEYFIFFRNNAIDQIVLDGRYANNYANGTFPILSIRGLVDYQGNAYDPVIAGAVNWSPHPGTLDLISSNDLMVLGSWNHVAIVRNSGTVNLYLNGTRQTANYTSNTTVATQSPWKFGALHNPGAVRTLDFKNIISNFRYVKGSAVYSGSSFTVPTSPLTAITNTKLLLFQSNRFVDNSATGHTLTLNGLPAVTEFGPFLSRAVYDPAVNGGSAYMDGSGDTLRVAWTAANIVNQNFTLEYWLYYTQTSGYGSVSISGSSGGGNSSGDDGLAHLSFLSTNGQVFTDDGQSSGSGPDTGAGGISPNSWHHLALVRVSDDMFIYINGVKAATKSLNTALFDEQSVELGVGVLNKILGYVTDVRLVTSAVYTGNTYTVPTAPLTAITNTKVLLNMTDGQAIDSATQNNLTLVADSKISTSQKKIGNSSLYLDGSGDYVSFPNTPFGTGDFTVECWVRCLGSTYDKGIWDNHTASGSSDGLTLTRIAAAQFRLFGTGELIRSGNFTITNTWVNVTVVRSSGTLNLFVNGVSQGTTSFTTNLNSTSDFLIGGGRYTSGGPSSGSINAYIDEFRTSHFARYTSNFTPTTEPFPDKGR